MMVQPYLVDFVMKWWHEASMVTKAAAGASLLIGEMLMNNLFTLNIGVEEDSQLLHGKQIKILCKLVYYFLVMRVNQEILGF